MYRTDFWTLWEKVRMGYSERIALKQVYYQGWNRSPAQVGCMRQVLRAGALGRPRGRGWRGRWEGGSGWGIHVNPWLIHVSVWQKPLQYCKVISLQLIKINGKTSKQTNKKNWFKCILFNGWVISHCVSVPQLSYPFVCWWTSRLLACPGYYKQCCNEYWGTRVSFNSCFLGVYAQEWDCWSYGSSISSFFFFF